MAGPDGEELLALAVDLATQTASLLRAAVDAVHEVETKTTTTDLVTATDRAAERLIVDGIRAHRPDDAILGEEGTADTGTSGVRWVVDPLDGTVNFFYGIPAFAVSIGVEVDGVPEVGVVADVLRQELFTARRGAGARLNGREVSVRPCVDPAMALVGTGFGYDPARRALQGAAVARLLPEVRDIRRFGAAAIDLCWVACGRLDAYYEVGLQPWDLAAGALIAAEAGALVGSLDGTPASGRFVLAAGPGVFEPLQGLLRAAGAAVA